ncbi:MAG: hypothetical protein EOP10_05505 [Proteobacteria bacterium]|nr:MAG: hypothetical protein EOP10_05505 [Pseudomonadota bacterium]
MSTLASAEIRNQEIDYIWQKGDTLSSVLFAQGVGHSKDGPRLYGRQGFIAQNEMRYGRKEWAELPAGSRVKILVPLIETAPVVSKEVLSEPVPEAISGPVTLPEAIPEPVIEESAQPKAEAKSEGKTKAVSIHRFEPTMDTTSIVLSACSLLSIVLGLVFGIHSQRKRVDLKKRELIARSFLSWLVHGASHTAEHINLAETVFMGDMKRDQLVGYELMGYFQKDLQILNSLDEKRRIEGVLPTPTITQGSIQEEFFLKYIHEARPVLHRILSCSRSRYFLAQCNVLLAIHTAHESAKSDESLPTAS